MPRPNRLWITILVASLAACSGEQESVLDPPPPPPPRHLPRDNQSTVWSIDGIGVEGSRKGWRLAQMPTVRLYWFVWTTFYPGTSVVRL